MSERSTWGNHHKLEAHCKNKCGHEKPSWVPLPTFLPAYLPTHWRSSGRINGGNNGGRISGGLVADPEWRIAQKDFMQQQPHYYHCNHSKFDTVSKISDRRLIQLAEARGCGTEWLTTKTTGREDWGCSRHPIVAQQQPSGSSNASTCTFRTRNASREPATAAGAARVEAGRTTARVAATTM